ncbi:MAG: major facilitator superfamily domain-containing protein 1 [Chlorobi bacterium]|nr:major facilitator superfamily domain-containing protein 1 [Chlorobiota bacterium]
MTEKIKQSLRDSKGARWLALGILSFTMFAGYLFTEIISPIKPLLESTYGWTSSDFGTVVSAYGWFNVFFLALIFVGILLDKFGIRFSTMSSAGIMVLGALIKYYSFAGNFDPQATILGMNIRVFYASIGYALFGVGVEYAGITVSKAVVKWFKGKEMALAMGMQVAIARLGSFVPLAFGAKIAKTIDIPNYILLGVVFLVIGLVAFFVYNTMDKKLDKEIGVSEEKSDEDDFKLSDLKEIFSNRAFWYIAILCVLFYGAVFPFYKYGPDLMVNKFGVPDDWAGLIPSLVPFGTIFLTPFFGGIYDKKGKGATIMIIGAVMLIIVHVIYYLPFITNLYVAVANAILLGIAFSLVPSAMWPSVPKIIPEKQLGSAYAAIFYIQNWGLMGIPFVVGKVLDKTNPKVVQAIKDLNAELTAQGLTPDQIQSKITELKAAGEFPLYNYETTWLIYVGLTVLALVFAYLLKVEDKKKGYGLELPNIEK